MTDIADEQKQLLRDMFNTLSEGYDNPPLRFFVESAKRLPKYLNPRGDEHVLDVATGTGHSAIALAEALPGGSVTGIDFSEGMLANARSKVEERGISNITLRTMDMQSLEFPPDIFDAAAFAFSLFFVDDMDGLLHHVKEKVKPGGGIIATSFADGTFLPLAGIFFERLKGYGVEPSTPIRRLSTPDECSSLFDRAGLTGVRVDTEDIGYYLTDAGQWWEVVWNTALRKFVSGLSTNDRKKFKEEHLNEVESLSDGNGIWLDVKVLYTQGVKGAV